MKDKFKIIGNVAVFVNILIAIYFYRSLNIGTNHTLFYITSIYCVIGSVAIMVFNEFLEDNNLLLESFYFPAFFNISNIIENDRFSNLFILIAYLIIMYFLLNFIQIAIEKSKRNLSVKGYLFENNRILGHLIKFSFLFLAMFIFFSNMKYRDILFLIILFYVLFVDYYIYSTKDRIDYNRDVISIQFIIFYAFFIHSIGNEIRTLFISYKYIRILSVVLGILSFVYARYISKYMDNKDDKRAEKYDDYDFYREEKYKFDNRMDDEFEFSSKYDDFEFEHNLNDDREFEFEEFEFNHDFDDEDDIYKL